MSIKSSKKNQFLLAVNDGGVTKEYGVYDKNGKHLGVDFGWYQVENCPVFAIQDGVVIANYYTNDKGWMVGVLHEYDDGTHRYSFYIHLKEAGAKFGTIVKQGDEIGTRGLTGTASTGTHLHIYVGKVTKETINLSQSVRDANWQKFLAMCDFNPMPYFYISKKITYTLSPHDRHLVNKLTYIEDIEDEAEIIKNLKTEVELLNTKLVEQENKFSNNLKALESDLNAEKQSHAETKNALQTLKEKVTNAVNMLK